MDRNWAHHPSTHLNIGNSGMHVRISDMCDTIVLKELMKNSMMHMSIYVHIKKIKQLPKSASKYMVSCATRILYVRNWRHVWKGRRGRKILRRITPPFRVHCWNVGSTNWIAVSSIAQHWSYDLAAFSLHTSAFRLSWEHFFLSWKHFMGLQIRESVDLYRHAITLFKHSPI